MNHHLLLTTLSFTIGLLCIQAHAVDVIDHQQDKPVSARQYDVVDIRFDVDALPSQPIDVEFVSVQLWQSELHSVMRNVCEAIPGKPILNIEHGGYERGPYEVFNGNYTSPEVCLERAYQCVFAGTYPTHYWQGAAWNVIIPDIDVLATDDRPRLDDYRHMRSFVDRFKLDQLKAGEKKSNAGFCLHDGNELFLYYVPKECDYFGLRLPKDSGDTMTVTWFDPLTGTYDEPTLQKITQWPTLRTPAGDGFHLLIVQLAKN